MKKNRTALRACASALIIALSLLLLQRLLTPKYVDDVVEGAFIAEFYEEEMSHDLLFIGDCEVYENFSPAVLWQDYGINSYIRGSAEQYIWQSCWRTPCGTKRPPWWYSTSSPFSTTSPSGRPTTA